MRRTFFILAVVAVALALAGCGSSGPTQVMVEEQSALTVEPPDTLLAAEPTPLPRAEIDIEPLRVTTFDEPDTTSASLPFTAVAYDSDELRIRLQDREVVLPAPATGETVIATPDTATGGLETGMKGRQQTRTFECPDTDDGPGFFDVLGWTAGSAIVILLLIFAIRIVG